VDRSTRVAATRSAVGASSAYRATSPGSGASSASTGSIRSRSTGEPAARPASTAAPADAASPDRRRSAGSPVTEVRTWVQTPSVAPAPANVRPTGGSAPPATTAARHRATSQATASTAARARSPASWAAPRPTKPARARSDHHGARAPSSHGTATTPRAPGPLVVASRASSAGSRPTSWPSQASRDPAADSPPSRSHPPSAERESTSPSGSGSGRTDCGTETLAVVPQLTIGCAALAPAPMTSHWRSPAPMTTGMPGASPSDAAGTARSRPITVSGGTTGASRHRAAPASPSTTDPSRS